MVAPFRIPSGALQGAVLVLALLVLSAMSYGQGTRDRPYKLGSNVRIGGFDVRVTASVADAWPRIAAHNPAADRPGPGATDFLVTLRATNRAATFGVPFVNGVLEAIGRSNKVYTPFAQSCGVIPGDYQNSDAVPPGGTVMIATCWRIRQADARSLVLFYAPYGAGSRTFFELGKSRGR